MRDRIKLVVLFVCAAGSILAQGPVPVPFPPPFPLALQNYLELTRDQAATIQRLNTEAMQFELTKLRRRAQVEAEIALETAKTTVDPMALGVRYLELEAIRREIASQNEKTYTEIQKVLNDAQKTKVQALVAALRMQGLICEAQIQNILPQPRPGNIIPAPQIPNFIRNPVPSILIPQSILGGCYSRSGIFLTGERPAVE